MNALSHCFVMHIAFFLLFASFTSSTSLSKWAWSHDKHGHMQVVADFNQHAGSRLIAPSLRSYMCDSCNLLQGISNKNFLINIVVIRPGFAFFVSPCHGNAKYCSNVLCHSQLLLSLLVPNKMCFLNQCCTFSCLHFDTDHHPSSLEILACLGKNSKMPDNKTVYQIYLYKLCSKQLWYTVSSSPLFLGLNKKWENIWVDHHIQRYPTV